MSVRQMTKRYQYSSDRSTHPIATVRINSQPPTPASVSLVGGSQIEINPFTFSRPSPSDNVTMATVAAPSNLVSRRPSSQGLPRLRIHRSEDEFDRVWDDGLVEEGEDVEEEGRQLFTNFVSERVKAEDPEAFADIQILTPAGYANPMWAKAGRDLRHMADLFAQTAERRRVKQKASEVNTNITYEEFRELLSELFAAGGITKERIVVLFFFCSDVAIRSLKRGAQLFSQFLQWSISFITESVCSWVRSHGGWGEVMCSSFNSLPRVLLIAGVTIIIGFGFMRYINR